MNRFRKLVLAVVIVLVPVFALSMRQRSQSQPQTKQAPPAPPLSGEVIGALQQKIASGQVKLEYEEGTGYLRSVLKILNIPPSSQSLVFGKNSFQLDLISPTMPRALYFNDDVYIGFVQGGKYLEVASVDPKLGPVFFTMEQEKRERPVFVKETSNCLVCHDSGGNGIPRLLVLSTVPDVIGTAMGQVVYSITDESPFSQRFGGWYVTGTHGAQRHMGNVFGSKRASDIPDKKGYIARMDLTAGANVTDLSKFFDTKPYLTPHSDIVAQLLLAHQTDVHNMISRAVHMVDDARKERVSPEKMQQVIKDYAEPIVESMLFANATPFKEPIKGDTDFAAVFSAGGKRDPQGRSFKDLDLKTRLLRYPMSYVVYTESFVKMPDSIKDYVYRRFVEVLTGKDKSEAFAHLSATDRQAIFDILKATQPEFALKSAGD